ncbi:proline dehydrogenase family protein [Alienimonas californiensis]|uniref:L-glutamate gamma-semialdehyde dehydrogenase n=1 Tax=Alienimonas californiensis TaxID=2527989 RepID=A0A517PF77_9PLAN|nr:proline dehydrogenase family protein [Alienimonas californiensis]QDT18022.1 1-pyrroline-5-carboxylate dehydrogenase [Alienimonas californiensis]
MAIAPPADSDLDHAASAAHDPPPAVRPAEPEALTSLDLEALDAASVRVATAHWTKMGRRGSSMFSKRFWDDRLMEWAMGDEGLKVQAFRFVDVLPTLRTHRAVTKHLREYFTDVSRLPAPARLALAGDPNSMVGKALAVGARWNARQMAERFIAGETVPEVLKTVRQLRRDGFAFTLDLLGEAVVSDAEADQYQRQYLDLIAGLAESVNAWPENEPTDTDHVGPIPRVNVSLKLSALFPRFNPADPEGTYEGVAKRLRPILRAAQKHGAFVNFDMEQYSYKTITLDIAKRVLTEDEFSAWPNAGLVIQAYLRDAEQDLDDLLKWTERRGTPITVRLVKGAYWDYETVTAAARGWPVPVFTRKPDSDACFERCTRFLMAHYETLRPAIASHNLRSLSHAEAVAEALEVPNDAWEVQMLYGMAGEQAEAYRDVGRRVRIYTPFGEPIPGMAYLVRRLLENSSNDSFVRHAHDPAADPSVLFMNPVTAGDQEPPEQLETNPPHGGFANEPLTDFAIAENREAMLAALAQVEEQLGGEYSLVINGRSVQPNLNLVSRDPADGVTIIGKAPAATPRDAADAVDAAKKAFPGWMRTGAQHRCEYLELAAEGMKHRRFELAAWIVREVGKPWGEADADVAEAIDFLNYYAQQMRTLAEGRVVDVPGEHNVLSYRPRGVAVVIAPWNFPLAILTGMTAAALATGNTVVMKPAEQSPVVGALLMDVLRDAGIPDGVVNYLPGDGELIGPPLVTNPDVSIVAFTGSREVGLAINAEAAKTPAGQDHVKTVIAEMGGKNAILVDNDADLDEAVLGVLHSAFDYAGQKCSACSRAIVLSEAYDDFMKRLKGAVASLQVGLPKDPGTQVGPVIDATSQARIAKALKNLGEEVELAATVEPGADVPAKGHYVNPQVYAGVSQDDPLANEELFGPVLAVIKVKTFAEAIEKANATDYALTAGVFSRSPENLATARRELIAGNIYLNRGCTGALVNRQPFGGFKLSGVGSKAGGPDYLLQFLVPVNVTENTMRRGFAPGAAKAPGPRKGE